MSDQPLVHEGGRLGGRQSGRKCGDVDDYLSDHGTCLSWMTSLDKCQTFTPELDKVLDRDVHHYIVISTSVVKHPRVFRKTSIKFLISTIEYIHS